MPRHRTRCTKLLEDGFSVFPRGLVSGKANSILEKNRDSPSRLRKGHFIADALESIMLIHAQS